MIVREHRSRSSPVLHDLTQRPGLRFAMIFCILLLPAWGHEGAPSLTWMMTLDREAYRTAGNVADYLLDLRTGIPPLLSALELLSWVEFRELTVFSHVVYPVSIALAFSLAFWLAARIESHRLLPALAVLLLAVCLTWQGVKVHAGNPALYDPIFSALLLGYFALLVKWLRARRLVWLAAAGTTLAILELTRPFMVYLLPVFVLVETHRVCRTVPRPRSALLAFVLPVVLLSGSWHLRLYLVHDGQIAWTNISGYNLQRAWADFDQEIRDAQHVNRPPRAEGLWYDLNRADVYRDSERIKSLILSKILDDPLRAVRYALGRIVAFGAAPTRIYVHAPQGLGITLYRTTAVALMLATAIGVVVGGTILLRRRRWPWLSMHWWLAASTLLMAVVLAIGEKGEEARLVFSMLPAFLAVAGFAVDRVASVFPWGRTPGSLHG